MNDTTKKEIARFVLTGSDDIAKMQVVQHLLSSKISIRY